jgi:hypothetical protein
MRGSLGIGLILFALAVVLPLLRQTGVRSWRTVWEEDGTIYFGQANFHGGLAVLFRGYSGYLQLPPRILGAIATLVPIQDLAVYFAVTAVVISAVLAWFVYYNCDGWIASRPVRLALASLVVLMPALGAENTANITDTIWVFAAVAPWALISLQERPRDVVIRSVVVFFAATSTVLCVMFVPLALGYAVIRKTRATWVVAVAFCVGLAVQAVVVLHSKRDYLGEPKAFEHIRSIQWLFGHPSASLLARFTGVRVFAMFLTGDKGISVDWRHHNSLLIIGSALCVGLILALLLPGAGRRCQALAVVLVLYAVITFVVPAWYGGIAQSKFRYSVIPVMMLASAVAVLVAPSGSSRDRTIVRLSGSLFVAYVLVVVLTGFSVTNLRSVGPSWSSSLAHIQQTQCLTANSDKLVNVPTQQPNPPFIAPFPVTLRCQDLPP